MPQSTHLTIGEVAQFFGAPAWRIRKIVDSLTVPIPRAGLYRLVPRVCLPTIGAALQQATVTEKEPQAVLTHG